MAPAFLQEREVYEGGWISLEPSRTDTCARPSGYGLHFLVRKRGACSQPGPVFQPGLDRIGRFALAPLVFFDVNRSDCAEGVAFLFAGAGLGR